jgi:hypothetical protein
MAEGETEIETEGVTEGAPLTVKFTAFESTGPANWAYIV